MVYRPQVDLLLLALLIFPYHHFLPFLVNILAYSENLEELQTITKPIIYIIYMLLFQSFETICGKKTTKKLHLKTYQYHTNQDTDISSASTWCYQ